MKKRNKRRTSSIMKNNSTSKGVILLVSPLLTGGTRRYILDILEAYKEEYIIILFEYRDAIARVSLHFKNYDVRTYEFMHDRSYIFLNRICKDLPIEVIHLNHLIHMDDELRSFFINTSKRWIITLHDYYTICPRINMYTNHGFCNNLDVEKCFICLRKDSYIKDIKKWRSTNREILNHADRVICPSDDMKKRLQCVFGDLKVDVVENPEVCDYDAASMLEVLNQQKTKGNDNRIGILGMLDEKKGSEILLSVCRYCLANKMNYQFILFGELLPHTRRIPANLQVTGRYKEKDIIGMIAEKQIDYFWFPARCPETYSYTLSIPIRCHIPVIATDLGAIGERIQKHGWGMVYPYDSPISDIVKQFYAMNLTSIKKNGDFTLHNVKVPSVQKLYGIKVDKNHFIDFESVANYLQTIFDNAAVTHHKKMSLFECLWSYKHLCGIHKYMNFFFLDVHRIFKEVYSKSWNDLRSALVSWILVLGKR